MAESFSGVPGVSTFQTGAIDVLTRIDFPNSARRVRLTFTTNDGKVATEGTDGGALGATDYYKVPADNDWSMFIDRDASEGGKGPASIYVTSAVATTTVTMMCEAG